jgi:hypothetical protein
MSTRVSGSSYEQVAVAAPLVEDSDEQPVIAAPPEQRHAAAQVNPTPPGPASMVPAGPPSVRARPGNAALLSAIRIIRSPFRLAGSTSARRSSRC